MRTTLDIDQKLLSRAMKVSGMTTKKAAVEAGLNELVRKKLREELVLMAGKTDLAISHKDLERMSCGTYFPTQ